MPLRITLVLAFAVLGPGVALAQPGCEAETAGLRALARGVQLDITAPAGLRSGGTVHVAWRAASRFPPKTPVFVAVAIPGEVRIEAPPLPKPGTTNRTRPTTAAPDLPGFLALPAAARAPLDLAFGAGRTLLLVPLYQPGSKLAGSADVRVFAAGALAVEAVVVAKTACGERSLGETVHREIEVAPGAPEIVVQDPFDIDVPKRIVISNSGRYRLHVFEGRYRVFEIATGAKLVDRAGHNPNFSPTSRFVVADIGDADGRDLEVIDLVSQQAIYTAAGPFVGWVNGDALLVDGTSQYGGLSVRPALISRLAVTSGDNPQDKPDDGLGLGAPGSCHACTSWTRPPMTLDWTTASSCSPTRSAVASARSTSWPPASRPAAPPQRGSGLPGPSGKDTDAKLKQFVAATYEVRPVEWKPGWNVRDGLAFSHIYDPLAKPDASLADQEWYKAAIPLRGQLKLASHAGSASPIALDAHRRPRRGRRAARRLAPERAARAHDRRGVRARGAAHGAQPLRGGRGPAAGARGDPVLQLAGERGRQGALRNREQEARGRDRASAARRSSGGCSPTFRRSSRISGSARRGSCRPFPMTAISPRARSSCPTSWRGSGAGRWTAIPSGSCSCSPSRAAAPSARGRSSCSKARRKAAGRVTNLSKALEGLWGGQYGATAQQTRLKPQLFFGRYLVIASVATRNIGIFDIKSGQKVALIAGMPQADLLEDVLLSIDQRHVIQLNSDGQFFLHEIATGRMALSGRYVDGEIILYTPEAYYWSSYEGAHFVQLRFPGLPGLYSFQQFAAVLNRPEVIKARLAGATAATPPRLVPPPVVEARLIEGPAGGDRRVQVQARSGEGLARLRLYEDGLLIGDRSMSGSQFAGEIALPADRQCALGHGPGHRQGRARLGAADASAEAGAGRARPPARRAGRRRHLCRGAAQAHLCQVRCPAPCRAP